MSRHLLIPEYPAPAAPPKAIVCAAPRSDDLTPEQQTYITFMQRQMDQAGALSLACTVYGMRLDDLPEHALRVVADWLLWKYARGMNE